MTSIERDRLLLTLELQQLYSEYGACLDEGRYTEWPAFFTTECVYKLVPRENFDRGLPLATLAFESRGMLEDRVFGITQTLFHAPYYQRHIIGSVRIKSIAADDAISSEANYLVVRTRQEELSDLFNVGRYLDVVVREDGRLRFKERQCIFDSELIANSIIYPI